MLAKGKELTASLSFNEAALFRTRKDRNQRNARSSVVGFNEAALFRTRKELRRRTRQFKAIGFNEAALFRTRKGRTRTTFDPHSTASMRPRSFERGKATQRLWTFFATSKLQ